MGCAAAHGGLSAFFEDSIACRKMGFKKKLSASQLIMDFGFGSMPATISAVKAVSAIQVAASLFA
jgi:hypothetical protein